MEVRYITSQVFLTEYKRVVEKSRYKDPDLKALIDNIVRKLLSIKQKRFSIALLKIKNREVRLPRDFFMFTNSFYLAPGNYVTDLNKLSELEAKGLSFEECICNSKEDNCDDSTEFKYTLKDTRCDNHCILDILMNPSFLSYSDYSVDDVGTNNLQQGTAYIMRPSMNDFYNLKYHVTGCLNLNADTGIEYKIDGLDVMTINMDDGYVMLSYLADYKDSDGYFLIPDEPFVIDAIKYSLYESEGLKKLLRNAADGHNKGFWRDMVSMVPRKMKAAEVMLQQISKDRLNTILETRFNVHTYNQGPFGEYVAPDNSYPSY